MSGSMFDALEIEEAAKYAAVWADPRYRGKAWGLDLWRNRREIFPRAVMSALDIGCGHGRLMDAWAREGIAARGLDIVDALDPEIRKRKGSALMIVPLWSYQQPARQFDLGVAADVLEHLPEMMVTTSLVAIARACRVVIAQTAEYPSDDWEGRPLHLTIKPAEWWRARMEAIGGEVEELSAAQRRDDQSAHLLRWTTPALRS